MYSLVSIPYYDHLTQCYKKVIKINPAPPPNSPLNAIVKRVGPIRLSPFQVDSAFSGCGGGGDLQLGGQHGGHQSWGTNWSDNLKKAVC